jgi:hypothetical protein
MLSAIRGRESAVGAMKLGRDTPNKVGQRRHLSPSSRTRPRDPRVLSVSPTPFGQVVCFHCFVARTLRRIAMPTLSLFLLIYTLTHIPM